MRATTARISGLPNGLASVTFGTERKKSSARLVASAPPVSGERLL